ncbi:stage II sporulation protein Q [Halolactibacillus alkaliphilus]|uniref:Stage II sporulation protein Q n=1 Tax=Halolactibacillus alkaliphilus TaxID=442899 RepID=A0A511X466_9BACI|nr:M23 family metallopeptidase [Halolactibacillus alkaliphilus]GEN57739.1 stage II sporulation protein Q [Halolactibacillus alkaliphilus]GGN73846.1 stage II sporulation protein Q [Halolactibacillus alkaliphilus]SFO98934.1 stage II sporulation protein Q [Halolactibacillus alkaliphilus]
MEEKQSFRDYLKQLTRKKGFYPALYVFVMMTLVTGVIWQFNMNQLNDALPDLETEDALTDDVRDVLRKKEQQESISVSKDQLVPVETLSFPVSEAFDVEQVTNFYEYTMDENEQLAALVMYNQQYYQSTGIDLTASNNTAIPVISVLAGDVSSVKNDPLLGGVIELTHDNKLKTYYAGLTDMEVEVGQSVKQGDVLGQMGQSEFRKDLGNHVHFEIRVNDVAINPNQAFEKPVAKIISDQQVTADESFDHLPTSEESEAAEFEGE